jgi:phosphoribosylformylglycinamidine synthase
VQELLADRVLTAGHDRSDGGLAVAILEMAFAGNCGVEVDLDGLADAEDPLHPSAPLSALFNEELGLIFEAPAEEEERILEAFWAVGVPCRAIGSTLDSPRIVFRVDGVPVLEDDMRDLRDLWEETSFRLDRLQADPLLVREEKDSLRDRTSAGFDVPFPVGFSAPALRIAPDRPRVAVVREEGSNSDRELSAAFHLAGFRVWDIAMSDLLEGRARLDDFQGIGFPGGFAYADVLDSAKGWAGSIRFNHSLLDQFQAFRDRPDTFSIGICNGCQLSALLGWVPWQGLEDVSQPRFIQNASGRFESRFCRVEILDSPAVMLRDMAGAKLGIWVAHGEGRAHFPDPEVMDRILEAGLAPIRYIDDRDRATTAYPFNPNGSHEGIAALTSRDGRHLALMPHPERSFLTWQWGWIPEEWKGREAASPWLKMFQNAREWCDAHR